MYISKITLDNVRCFKHIVFNFTSPDGVRRWCVVLGDNGAGKSTLLRSLAMGLCNKTGASGLLQDTYGDWIGRADGNATITIDLIDDGERRKIVTTILPTSNAEEELEQATNPPNGEFPWHKLFVCGYGANRSILGDEAYEKYSSADALYTLFHYEYSLQAPELMLRRLARHSSTEEKRICKWLDKILMLKPGSVHLGAVGLYVRQSWQDEKEEGFAIGSLPDGHVATMTMILDMLGWALLDYYGKHKEKPKFTEQWRKDFTGIVIVDEIEQHLHPSWQRKIISLLNHIFPNVQFICTSHSPLCAAGLADLEDEVASLYVLNQDEDGFTILNPLTTMSGWRYDEILSSEAFGVPVRNDATFKIMDKIEEIYLGEKMGGKKEKLLKSLMEELGERSLVGEEAQRLKNELVKIKMIQDKLGIPE